MYTMLTIVEWDNHLAEAIGIWLLVCNSVSDLMESQLLSMLIYVGYLEQFPVLILL